MKNSGSDRVLIFDVWGDFACFRRFYTTRSPLTYNFPPRPTLAGLVGAISGIGKEHVAEVLSPSKADMTVRLLRPVKKMRLGINWVETKEQALSTGYVTERTQVLVEFVKDPHYRVYLRLKDGELTERLAQLLRGHQSVYTPCLGLSELLADFRWVGEEETETVGPGIYPVISVLPLDRVLWPDEGTGINFGSEAGPGGKRYDKKRMPRAMSADRKVTEWHDVLCETSGSPIEAHIKEGYRVSDGVIVFL